MCAYQFLTGRPPHEYASLTELALKQQQDPVAPVREYRPEVPPELDDAVRVALERDPEARYADALEMAEAIEAGTHGEATAATQRLGMSDYDTTQALDDTAATRAMPRTTMGPSPTRVHEAPPTAGAGPGRARRDERAAAQRAARRRAWGSFLALLAAIAAIAIVAIALLSSSSGAASTPSTRGTLSSRSTASATSCPSTPGEHALGLGRVGPRRDRRGARASGAP